LVPGRDVEVVLEGTNRSNGTTFDLDGRLIICEGFNRRVTRMDAAGRIEVLASSFEGRRLNRPNDVVCRSDGSIWFTDPGMRVPLPDRDLDDSSVFRMAPDGQLTCVAHCEYPNGLAFSPDESVLYVSNTRHAEYIHALEVDEHGALVRRRIFADMSSDRHDNVPDGLKVDAQGRVFCTGAGGIWVFEPDGTHVGTIATPERCANLTFGGDDLRTLFLTASTSVYTMRTRVPGLPHPWYSRQPRR